MNNVEYFTGNAKQKLDNQKLFELEHELSLFKKNKINNDYTRALEIKIKMVKNRMKKMKMFIV